MKHVKSESEPIEVSKSITWQEQFQQKLDEALQERTCPESVVYYRYALSQELPGPSWEQFHNSFFYDYWLGENTEEIEKVRMAWTHEILSE